MCIPQVRAAAEGMDATGNVKRLAGRVFNAENLTITDEGRIFVTGSEAAYELATNGTLNNIPIENLPQDCMRNGITTDDNFLYLACTRVHSDDTSFVPRSWCDISKLEQTPLSFFRIIFAEKVICQVDSYIVRASLEEKISFDHVVTRKVGRFFANGLTIDASRILYVANSFSGASSGIYRVPSGADATAHLELWHQRAGCVPNGMKVGRGAVYYTGFQLLPLPSSVLIQVEIRADGSAGKSEVIYRRLGAFFDDFDIVETGFIVADVGDLRASPLGSGALLFVDINGRLVDTFKHEYLKHPSAVKMVEKKAGQFEKGDILATEKAGHCLVWLRPDGILRGHFRFSNATDNGVADRY